MNIRASIKRLPTPLYKLARRLYRVVPLEKRLGPHFVHTQQLIARTSPWETERLENFQLERFKELVAYAVRFVPFYTELYKKHGLDARDIRTHGDIKRLPCVSKEDLRDNLSSFIAVGNEKSRLEYMTTGGSTALPVGFYLERGKADPIEWAFIYDAWSRVGYRPGASSVVFRGGFVGSEAKGQYWSKDPLRNELHFSSYHLTDEMIPVFLNEARRFQPEYIQAYPSAITMIAKYLHERGQNPREFFPRVRAILCGSENLFANQRALLENVFQCPTLSWYGQAERVILAAGCERSPHYHIYPQYGYAEVVTQDGREAGPGEAGELIGTGFHNLACPLIRYRTKDIATVGNVGCGCGRNYRLLEHIDGRLQEFIVTARGRLISMAAINMHSDVFDDIRQFQFVQRRRGAVELHVVPSRTYNTESAVKIKRVVGEKLGSDMTLELKAVDAIGLANSGKSRFLIQELPLESWCG